MRKIRVIPCLDLFEGRVVKGVNFVDLVDAGDPVEIGKAYCLAGADELVLLDIAATHDNRKTMIDMVRKVADNVTVSFTVGGGIRKMEDVEEVLQAGADKVSISSAAVNNPDIIKQAAKEYGSNRIVAAIDGKRRDHTGWNVYKNGGRIDTGLDVVDWAKKVEELGAGEILLTSMDGDGTKDGYDIQLTKAVTSNVNIPVTASGGAGKLEDFYEAIVAGGASGVLAASLFHFKELEIKDVKEYLLDKGISVDITPQ